MRAGPVLTSLTEEQEALVALCRDFAAREIRPIARAVDEADTQVPWEVWWKAADAGITSFMIDEAFGGGGVTDCVTACLVQEELCYGDAGIGNLLTSNGFFAAPVEALGTPEQRKRWLGPLTGARPPMTAVAVTEPEVGSDAAGLATRAVRTDAGYALTGRKAWISNAGVAEAYVVFATVDPAQRARGVTAFVVRHDDPGVSVGPPVRKMGQRAIRSAELVLDGVELDADRRLGEEGQGFYGLMGTFDQSRIVLGAAATGLARAALDYAREYACAREQFGKPIIEHQAVGFRLADVATRIDAARLLVMRAAQAFDAGQTVTTEAAMAKLFASETAMFATWAAVQTLGGWGYSREFPVEQWMRDAKLEEIEEGTSDIQRLVIARSLQGPR